MVVIILIGYNCQLRNSQKLLDRVVSKSWTHFCLILYTKYYLHLPTFIEFCLSINFQAISHQWVFSDIGCEQISNISHTYQQVTHSTLYWMCCDVGATDQRQSIIARAISPLGVYKSTLNYVCFTWKEALTLTRISVSKWTRLYILVYPSPGISPEVHQ